MRLLRTMSWSAVCLLAAACGPPGAGGVDGGASSNTDAGTDKFTGTWQLTGTAQMPNGPNWPISFPMTVSKAGNGVDYQFVDGDCVLTFTPQSGASAPTLVAAANTACAPGSTAVFVFNGAATPLDRSITVTLTSASVVWSTVNGVAHLTVTGVGTLSANGNTSTMTYTYDAVH